MYCVVVVACQVVRMVMRHHEELRQKEEKAKRDEHAKIRRVASSIAKEVRAFWSSVEKVTFTPLSTGETIQVSS